MNTPNIQLIAGCIMLILAIIGVDWFPQVKNWLISLIDKFKSVKPNDVVKPTTVIPSTVVYPKRLDLEDDISSSAEAHIEISRLLSFFSSRKDETGILTCASLGKHLYSSDQTIALTLPKPKGRRKSIAQELKQ